MGANGMMEMSGWMGANMWHTHMQSWNRFWILSCTCAHAHKYSQRVCQHWLTENTTGKSWSNKHCLQIPFVSIMKHCHLQPTLTHSFYCHCSSSLNVALLVFCNALPIHAMVLFSSFSPTIVFGIKLHLGIFLVKPTPGTVFPSTYTCTHTCTPSPTNVHTHILALHCFQKRNSQSVL